MKDLNLFLVFFITEGFLLSNCQLNKNVKMINIEKKIASELVYYGYDKLFQSGSNTIIDSLYDNGKNTKSLINIVSKREFDILARLLASEILFTKQKDYPPKYLYGPLGDVYALALLITGDTANPKLSGNLWGYMYEADRLGIKDDGMLGTHLLGLGEESLPFLIPLLDEESTIIYEGSQEATIGNALNYRVKDAAAYYISKIKNIPVKFYQDFEERDKEIERLKNQLKTDKK
jgi:hypothetical protein